MIVAILGATGHIGRALTYFLPKKDNIIIKCFVRNPSKMNDFLRKHAVGSEIKVCKIGDFLNDSYDAVINCIGIGKNDIRELFGLTEYFDNLVISYLSTHRDCKYINISSGAVYGNQFMEPAGNKRTEIPPNDLSIKYHTTIIKLNSELKHRTFSDYYIVDVRLFSFYSRFLDEGEHYFMADILRAIKNDVPLITNDENIMRDYVAPQDLAEAVQRIMEADGANVAFDLYSTRPISKMEIIAMCQAEFHMKVQYSATSKAEAPSGEKINYYSTNHGNCFGWEPKCSSRDTILQEMKGALFSAQTRA